MVKRSYLFPLFAIYLGVANGQHPVVDEVADKVIERYQQASCQQLLQKRTAPRTAKQQEAIQLLQSNPEIRTAFLNRVAGPIANKLFDCGMIP